MTHSVVDMELLDGIDIDRLRGFAEKRGNCNLAVIAGDLVKDGEPVCIFQLHADNVDGYGPAGSAGSEDIGFLRGRTTTDAVLDGLIGSTLSEQLAQYLSIALGRHIEVDSWF